MNKSPRLRASGSPPRVREKPDAWVCDRPKSGITPACAGKTNQQLGGATVFGDHPRVCGKNLLK